MQIRFLADVNVERLVVEAIRQAGYDVTYVQSVNPLMQDDAIVKLANQERRILVTNDKDFGEIVFRQQLLSEGVILIRIKSQDTAEKIILIQKLLQNHSSTLSGHFTVVGATKFRFIKLTP